MTAPSPDVGDGGRIGFLDLHGGAQYLVPIRGRYDHESGVIPFPETKAYVEDILDAWTIYRRTYGDELNPPS